MEQMQESLSKLIAHFTTKMAKFEEQLKDPAASTSTSSELLGDYTVFKTFILESLNSLQRQLEFLAADIDRIKTQNRRKILLLHGVSERKSEDSSKVVADIMAVRNSAWFSKSKLKGTGMTLSEFLTRSQHDFLRVSGFGINKCWTRDGYVYIITPNGARHRIVSIVDLNKIDCEKVKKASSTKTAKVKRPVTNKK
ncbi:hypothetical protein ACJJTC_001591 [Scirpophaga incertulas]